MTTPLHTRLIRHDGDYLFVQIDIDRPDDLMAARELGFDMIPYERRGRAAAYQLLLRTNHSLRAGKFHLFEYTEAARDDLLSTVDSMLSAGRKIRGSLPKPRLSVVTEQEAQAAEDARILEKPISAYVTVDDLIRQCENAYRTKDIPTLLHLRGATPAAIAAAHEAIRRLEASGQIQPRFLSGTREVLRQLVYYRTPFDDAKALQIARQHRGKLDAHTNAIIGQKAA